MPLYRYTARHAGGARTSEEVVAESARALRDGLRKAGWSPTSVRELDPPDAALAPRASALSAWSSRWKRHRRRAACGAFFDGVGTLLTIGMPLVEAIASVGENASGRAQRRLCMRLAESVREGDPLSGAMALAPGWFDAIDASVIRSAERSGELARACADLADRHASRDELSSRIVASLSYPCVLLLLGLGVAGFLCTYTLPKIVGVLRDNDAPLPQSTALLLNVSGVIAQRPILTAATAAACAALVLLVAIADRCEPFRWRVPILGRILKESALARVATQIAWLVDTGVPLHEAIGLAAKSTPSPAVRGALATARTDLADGVSITESVRTSGVFGGVFVRAVALGDEAGEIAPILHRLGDRYRRSAVRSLERLTSIIEPGAIIALAGLIGFVAYASIMPMLRVSESLYI